MSMWCLMAAPLIFSGDMAKLDEFTLNVLCNAEVIDGRPGSAGQAGHDRPQTDDEADPGQADGGRLAGRGTVQSRQRLHEN